MDAIGNLVAREGIVEAGGVNDSMARSRGLGVVPRTGKDPKTPYGLGSGADLRGTTQTRL